jgi:hypothetical protein
MNDTPKPPRPILPPKGDDEPASEKSDDEIDKEAQRLSEEIYQRWLKRWEQWKREQGL